MKKTLLLIALVGMSALANAQMPPFSACETNNVRALVYGDGGNMLTTIGGSDCVKWEVPKGGGVGTIYQQGLWLGGLDASDSLHLAAIRFGQGKQSSDFFSGPLRLSDASTDLTTVLKYHHVWNLTRTEIEEFKSNYGNASYEIPFDILTWPAHGEEGFASNLAPFVDVNHDNRYNPADGDYPDIKGDQCLFFIFNDSFDEHYESGGGKVGVEIHGMYYAFDDPDDEVLNNTVFVNYKVYNRSSNNYHNSYLGVWTDWDLGYSWDDFVGCDVRRGSCFAYNGQPEDEQYGDNVPVQVCTILAGPYLDADGRDNPAFDGDCNDLFNSGYPLDRYGYNGFNFGNGIVDDERYGMCGFVFHENSYAVNGDPEEARDYYNYMRGVWKDGSPMQYGGNAYNDNTVGPNCKFMFPGDSDPCNFGTNGIAPNGGFNIGDLYWDEVQSGDMPSDRRGLAAIGPFNLDGGRMQELDYAVITVWKNDSLTAMERKGEYIDHIRNLFEDGFAQVKHEQKQIAFVNPWNGNVQVFQNGRGTENDPFLIESAENLAFLSYFVNKRFDSKDLYFKQTVDIDLNGSELLPWTPIGTGKVIIADDGCDYPNSGDEFYCSFKGHYDGGGHRISNLYVDTDGFAGLFGAVLGTEDALVTIENVFLENGYVKGTTAGGIVGKGDVKVSGCWNGADIEGETAGGLVGHGDCIIHNCYNVGKINGGVVGGILGWSKGDIDGGIESADCMVMECYNNGDIVSTSSYSGGIGGWINTGGIVNCYNTGKVEAANQFCGGIIGRGGGMTVENCYNIGDVACDVRSGGIGYVSGHVNNCFYLNTCGAEGKGTPKTSEEMLDAFFVDTLNVNTDAWGIDLNLVNNGYPILKNNNLEIGDNAEKCVLTVYPNPATDSFVVEGSGVLSVFNVLGQQLMKKQLEDHTTITLPSGLYLLRLNTKGRVLTAKILIE